MAGAGGQNMEQFEAYFQRADLDRDGRISGAEAVAFFQGSNLPKQVLAQIWMHADQSHTGYLSRPEFYNYLKLVTVGQSKRELTPDIVKAALHGPASTKIPAPKINLPATSVPLPNSVAAAPSSQLGAPVQPSAQNFGFGGQAPSITVVNQQFGMQPSSTGMNHQLGQAPSTTALNQQFGLATSIPGLNQQFRPAQPSTTGTNQQFGQIRPSNTGMNQQFGQIRPSNTGMNQQFGQLQLSSTGMNQHLRPAPAGANINQQFFPSQGSQSLRPSLPMPAGATSHLAQAAGGPNVSIGMGPGLPISNNDWFAEKTGAGSTGPTAQVLDRGGSPSIQPVALSGQNQLSVFSSMDAKDPKGLVGSGSGFTSNSMFGSDVYSANQSSSKQVSSEPLRPTNGVPTSSAIVPVATNSQPSAKPDPFEALNSTLMKPSGNIQAPQPPSLPKSNQHVLTQVTSSGLSSVPAGVVNSTSEQPQISWPKMTRASIQKYAKVFVEVDTDRDGKITGEQARSLFLSWRLPREILKQVWDLSDQDSDSMLSLREFCIALYLMERYREGHALPSVLPNSIMLDESLLSLAGPPIVYGRGGWDPTTGSRPQQSLPGTQPVTPGLRPPEQPIVSQEDVAKQFNQQNARGSATDNFHAYQLNNGQENFLDKKQEAAETSEKVLLDSREKLEFYRAKMQDLVLYKSRCDNRLNEITERARADKSEAELLEKKYQEKYKQVAEIHSKLTIEEASFREIQERQMELQQAITKMEQGGSSDGILQVRADRIQSDLEELLKALNERCNKHAIELKSSAVIELPAGWQPGIPELAAIWDEDWDKFDDEGFSFDVAIPANAKSESVQRENSSPTHSFSPDTVSNADASENHFGNGASALDAEAVFVENLSRSPPVSPGTQTRYRSPPQEDAENHSEEDSETHRSFDESNWGNFDNNDDIDSVWGFNAKDLDHGKHEERYFFGSNEFGASPGTGDSPQADSAFRKNSPFTFEESGPGTPHSRAGISPRYSMDSRDPFSDSFSRRDSFAMHDSGSSPRQGSLARFDSISSTRGFDHSSKYSFDDSDPFGSSGPFKVSSETPKKGSEDSNAF